MLKLMEKNRAAITQEMAILSFYMQGGLSFNDAHLLSSEQREIMSKVIEKHYQSLSGKGSKLIG